MDLFWTPGWKDLLSLVVPTVGTLGGVWLGQRIHLQTHKQSRIDAINAEIRQSVAELLSVLREWEMSWSNLRQSAEALAETQERPELAFDWTIAEKAVGSLQELSRETSLICARVGLLTKDDQLLGVTDGLADELRSHTIKLLSIARHPSRMAGGIAVRDIDQTMNRVRGSFNKIEKVARERIALDPAK